MGWATPPPPDPDLPGAGDLLRPEPASALLGRFLEARGWEIQSATPVQAVHWPGRSCTVRYRVRARWGDGRPATLTLCAETRNRPREPVPPPEGFGRRFGLDDPVEEREGYLVWAYPYDPRLPGLPEAAHGPSVRAAARLTVPSAVAVTPVRYRPTHRAVFRYRVVSPGKISHALFGKILRPDAHLRTFQAHRALSRWPARGIRIARPRPADAIEGLVLFPALEGATLRDRLVEGGPLPSPGRVVHLVARLGRAPWRGPNPKPRRPARSIRSSGRLLAHLLPHRRAEVWELVGLLAHRAAATESGPVVHGDLYDAQIFVGSGFALGLIDLEDAGPGDPLLDAANLLAHLTGLAASVPSAWRRPLGYRALLRQELLDAGAADAELSWREALCAALLATGPFRAQSPSWPRKVETRFDAALRLARAAG